MKKKLNLKNKFYPVNEPLITKKNAKDVYRSMLSGWVSSDGPNVKIFEKKLASLFNRQYGISVSSGTAALEIAVKSLNLKKDSEVIVSDFSIISTALAVVKNNCSPVFVDCDPITWNMKIEEIEKKINKRTKCIIATHIYGYPVVIDKIAKICKKYKLYLIEDAAEMIGHKYKGRYCGSFGDLSIISFYANKHITTGEGGMIFTNKKKLEIICKNQRNLCFGSGDNRYMHTGVGWNYRMSNIQAKLGLSQIDDISKIIKKKKEVGKNYFNILKNFNNIYVQQPVINSIENIYWVVGLVFKKKINLSNLRSKLLKKGVQTRPFFYPLHKQPFLKKFKRKNDSFYNTIYISKYGMYLPSSISLRKKDILEICSILKKTLVQIKYSV